MQIIDLHSKLGFVMWFLKQILKTGFLKKTKITKNRFYIIFLFLYYIKKYKKKLLKMANVDKCIRLRKLLLQAVSFFKSGMQMSLELYFSLKLFEIQNFNTLHEYG